MLCLLGPPALRVGGLMRRLKLRPKGLALIVRIALDGPVPRADLAGLLFPDAADPRAALRWHLTYLRAQLPEPLQQALVVTPENMALSVRSMSRPSRLGPSASSSIPMIQQPLTCLACTEVICAPG